MEHKESISGCTICFQAAAEAMADLKTRFRPIARLVDESHFGISILACPVCDQRCISIFTETIDWVDGEDPQYVSVMPLTLKESEELIARGEDVTELIESLGRDRRHLRSDYPKGAPKRVYWADGDLHIRPHD